MAGLTIPDLPTDLMAALLAAEERLIVADHHDPRSMMLAASGLFAVASRLDGLGWVDRCCDPLYGHLTADACGSMLCTPSLG